MTQQDEIIYVPDIGNISGVEIIDIMVGVGDDIEANQALITIESDKATVDIPSSARGKVLELLVKKGDKVSEGSPIVKIKPSSSDIIVTKPVQEELKKPKSLVQEQIIPVSAAPIVTENKTENVYASPSVRRLARELNVALTLINGSGNKGRIMREDLLAYIKSNVQQGSASSVSAMMRVNVDDFTQFGEVEVKSLNKIKRLTAEYTHRSWLTVPHVTQFDEANITELESFRKEHCAAFKDAGCKLTILAFVIKALTRLLISYPQFNSSLEHGGERLIYKKYINIGIAVDTPNGLVVPIVKQADQKNVSDIAKEMQRLSASARDNALLPSDLKGGTFTVSSLGGIGGTAFTPIVNSPEVAILGLSRAQIKPHYDGNTFIPRLMLPLALSYDHRVIDGAEAARFMRDLVALISDIRGILL